MRILLRGIAPGVCESVGFCGRKRQVKGLGVGAKRVHVEEPAAGPAVLGQQQGDHKRLAVGDVDVDHRLTVDVQERPQLAVEPGDDGVDPAVAAESEVAYEAVRQHADGRLVLVRVLGRQRLDGGLGGGDVDVEPRVPGVQVSVDVERQVIPEP
jgi:hypothetical protein